MPISLPFPSDINLKIEYILLATTINDFIVLTEKYYVEIDIYAMVFVIIHAMFLIFIACQMFILFFHLIQATSNNFYHYFQRISGNLSAVNVHYSGLTDTQKKI